MDQHKTQGCSHSTYIDSAVTPVSVLLSKATNNRVVEPGPQVILLGDGIDLLAVVGEAVGNGLLLDLNFSPGVVA